MYVIDGGRRFVIPRTELTYPCHQLRMHQNAAGAPVDHVMADFEDACPYEFKGEASRQTMVEALSSIDFGLKVVTIRPNNIKSKFFLGDLQAIMLGAPDRFHGIILPKTNGPEDIVYLARLLEDLEQQGGWTTRVQVEALIETPLGVVNAYQIATASDRMVGLIFGIADFAAALGVNENVANQNQNFHYAKQATVVAAKAAGLHAIDNAFLTLIRRDTPEDEAARIREDLRQKNIGARDLGMDGAWVIHPQQAEIANQVFTPDDEQIARAKLTLEYYHKAGGGALVVPETGEFHDEATIKGLLMQLAKAVQAGVLDAGWLGEQAAKSAAVTGYDILTAMGRRG
ncbi:MAG: CoA ester lyase [Chloroflexi bacterium]|nr:CoA ester lyase [Chloroflexota bacterium]